ncbi:hypothetical protein Hdeb2414_s0006g00207311 [Helianthus debilis subsp. tardiflorus]
MTKLVGSIVVKGAQDTQVPAQRSHTASLAASKALWSNSANSGLNSLYRLCDKWTFIGPFINHQCPDCVKYPFYIISVQYGS